MIALIFYFGVGIGLFVLLYVLARRDGMPAQGSAHQFVEAAGALHTLQYGLLPGDLVGRIFDRPDLEYVTTKTSPEIRRLFLTERKRIALSWVRRLRLEIVNLMHFHRSYSRFHSQLGLLTELRLALDFAGLLLVCRILEMLFYFRGTYAAPRMVRGAASAAARLCTASEKSLAFLNAPNVQAFIDKSRRGNATV